MFILRDYMVTPVLTVSKETTLTEAAKLMAENKFGSLVVEDNGEHVGMLTATDITYRLVAKGLDPNATRVGEIFSQPLISMDFMLSCDEALSKMEAHKIERLPITQSNKVVGIISINDLMQILGD